MAARQGSAPDETFMVILVDLVLLNCSDRAGDAQQRLSSRAF